MNNPEYFIKCSRCGKKRFYKNKNSFNANKNKNSVCMQCKHELHSEKLKGRSREFT